MAIYPCSNHHAPFRGPASAAYPALVNGVSSDRKHLRLCPTCFRDYLEAVAAILAEVDYDSPSAEGPGPATSCSFCREFKEIHARAFVSAYPSKEEERTFFGYVCLECLPRAKTALLLS